MRSIRDSVEHDFWSRRWLYLSLALIISYSGVISEVAPEPVGIQSVSVSDPIRLIRDDFEQGVLSIGKWAQLTLTAIKNPEQLPSPYLQVDLATTRLAHRGATAAILEIVMQWDQFSPETQEALSALLIRPTTSFSYVSLSGYFRLHYDTMGTDAVSSTDADANGHPDYVERIASYMDSSLSSHVDLAYLLPPNDNNLGGDTLYDVYFEKMPYYGYAVPENIGPAPWNDYSSYIVMNRNFIDYYFPPNSDPEGNLAGAAKATAAHEFHHASQFSYDATEYIWFMELDATYMEDVVFDLVNDNYNYLPTFMENPETSLMAVSLHMYASFIWGVYLAQTFDPSLLVAIWEGARYGSENLFGTLADTLDARYGWSVDSAFADFAVWNFLTGERDDGQHFEEASNYPLISPAATHSFYPVLTMSPPQMIEGYAASYIQFLPGNAEGPINISFDGSNGTQWSAFLIISTSINQHQIEQIELDGATQSGSFQVPDMSIISSVTLVGINLSEFSGDASFLYSASEPSPYAVQSSILTDTLIYSGATRMFEYEILNPSAIGDVYDIQVSDDSSWITPDTIDIFLGPGESRVLAIPVTPPAGTALGNLSTLYFRAVSRSDQSVFDEQTTYAVTVLQRGDVNFNGSVDITDLVALIDYMYITFTPPIPIVEAGNVNCQGGVNILDLVALINWLYLTFDPPPCNLL